MPFDEAAHPRGEAGSAEGGQFVAAQSSSKTTTVSKSGKGGGKSGGKGLAYNAKTGVGAGYGSKNGDPRVRKLQQLLTKLGIKDARGKPLVIDGKLGPRTTEAIKAAQRKLGLKPDGVLTAGLVRRLAKPRMAKAHLTREKTRTFKRAGDGRARAKKKEAEQSRFAPGVPVGSGR
ncbi:peptidoglycan-binding domain-containing protein [Spirillospora sp. CA-128828]|uniref:peptidoglycan-binding domain-containing protein n=1 Tax=Spirillospora sp. CA-128828 TaxID=3240033 RepID=UPI003D8C84D1